MNGTRSRCDRNTVSELTGTFPETQRWTVLTEMSIDLAAIACENRVVPRAYAIDRSVHAWGISPLTFFGLAARRCVLLRSRVLLITTQGL